MSRAPIPVYAATILLSACLLFLVQPIIAKQIVPWFGGSAGVWTVCLVFFQVVLLAGYAYAHALTQASPRRQAQVHTVLLVASLVALPIIPPDALKPAGDQDAALRILLLLAVTVGLPYFLLSSTGPLLQRWVAHRFPERTVYRLFALSNFGSLIGLLAFPFAIEPFASSRQQSWAWSVGYAAFVAGCSFVAWRAARDAPDLSPDGSAPADVPPLPHAATGLAADLPADPAPGLGTTVLWLVLAALGSVLLLAVTSHVTQNIASVPFLWIVPLTLYLLSFVVVFEGRGGRGWYDPRWGQPVTLLFAAGMAWALTASNGVLDVTLAVPVYCSGLFFACVFCHGEMALRKPSPRWLTRFYLALSAGGAAGGLLVGLVAPRVFDAYFELPLGLVALGVLALLAALMPARGPTRGSAIEAAGAARGAATAEAGSSVPTGRATRVVLGAIAAAATVACVAFGLEYRTFIANNTVVMVRNFYGMLRVREGGTGEARTLRLLHGVILHGEQPVEGERRYQPGTYYGTTSGVGLAVAARQQLGPVKLGVIGLGVGTMAAYGRAGDVVRFYEINPAVVGLARETFGYLTHTPADLQIALGDARLVLERELSQGPQGLDVLVVDAFSSDAIPVHLLTREAVAMYMKHMKPGGFVALHISNRFLDLQPVLANIAQAEGLVARHVADSPEDDTFVSSTDWVLLTRDATAFTQDEVLMARADEMPPDPRLSVWSDRFNNLLEVLRTRPLQALRALAHLDDD